MTCLACVVVFCTVYALILPAVTIENNVSTSNTAVNENTFVPPEKNIYPIDAYNTFEEDPNVILLSPWLNKFSDYPGLANNTVFSIENFLYVNNIDAESFSYNDWFAYFIQVRGGRFQVIRAQVPNKGFFVYKTPAQPAYIILVKKSYKESFNLYFPTPGQDKDWVEVAQDGDGDTVQINWIPGGNPNTVQNSSETPLAYFTFSPKENNATPASRDDDLPAIADSAIKFQLFDYNENINRPADNPEGWRKITDYFQFRGIEGNWKTGIDTGSPNSPQDAESFNVNHATVERKLDNGYPVLDPNRNALGQTKEQEVTAEQLPMNERSLKYLFSGGDHAVTAYSPTNTILQKNGTYYFYPRCTASNLYQYAGVMQKIFYALHLFNAVRCNGQARIFRGAFSQ